MSRNFGGTVWSLPLLGRNLTLGLRAGGLASGFVRSGILKDSVLPVPTSLVPGAPRPGGVGTGTSPVRAAPGTEVRRRGLQASTRRLVPPPVWTTRAHLARLGLQSRLLFEGLDGAAVRRRFPAARLHGHPWGFLLWGRRSLALLPVWVFRENHSLWSLWGKCRLGPLTLQGRGRHSVGPKHLLKPRVRRLTRSRFTRGRRSLQARRTLFGLKGEHTHPHHVGNFPKFPKEDGRPHPGLRDVKDLL
eukprot:4315418-Amphidinium_carterae.1